MSQIKNTLSFNLGTLRLGLTLSLLAIGLVACGQSRAIGNDRDDHSDIEEPTGSTVDDAESTSGEEPNDSTSPDPSDDVTPDPEGGEDPVDEGTDVDPEGNDAPTGDDPDPQEPGNTDDTTNPGDETDPEARNICWPVGPITCEQGVTANTVYAAPSVISSYACLPAEAIGPELAYTFIAPTDMDITASLTPLTGVNALDLFVLKDQGDGCNSEYCFQHHGNEVSWQANAGETYYLVIDAITNTSGLFELNLSCEATHNPGTDTGDTGNTGDTGTPTGDTDTGNTGGGTDTGTDDSASGGSDTGSTGGTDSTGDSTDSDSNSGSTGGDSGSTGDSSGSTPDDTTPPNDTTPPEPVLDDGFTCMVDWTIGCNQPVEGNTDFNSQNNIDRYSCSTWWETGPEQGYAFTTTVDQTVTAVLDPHGMTDLDVYILEDLGDGCNADTCIEYGNYDATWNAEAGMTYYVMIDGFSMDSGSYNLILECDDPAGSSTPTTGGDSGTGDGNGPVAPEPVPEGELLTDGESCTSSRPIGCGQTLIDDTELAPPSNITLYSCSTWWESGPEIAYMYYANFSGEVTAYLHPTTGVNNLDLFLIEDDGNGCNANSCIDSDGNEIVWNAVAGHTYYIVVDGFSMADGAYELTLTCN